jgi:hypothetical protein
MSRRESNIDTRRRRFDDAARPPNSGLDLRPCSAGGGEAGPRFLYPHAKEHVMRFSKPQLGRAVAAAAVAALAVTLFVTRGVVEVLLMVLIAAALVGMYSLRRYARAELLYSRHVERRRRPSAVSEETRSPTTPELVKVGETSGCYAARIRASGWSMEGTGLLIQAVSASRRVFG